jgi:hypothetical protein
MCDILFARKWLNPIGLSLGLIGVVFIWIWGPPQRSFEPGIARSISDANVLEDGRTVKQYNEDLEVMKRYYQFMSRFGLALILLGFVFQLANEFALQEHH